MSNGLLNRRHIVIYLLLNFLHVFLAHRHYEDYRNTSRSYSGRTPRFISFTTEDEDIHIDLEFVVPFLKVPVKRSIEQTGTALKSLVNINTASVIISGLFIAVGAGIGAAVNGYSFPTAMGKVFSGFMRKNKKSGAVFDPLKFISRQPDGKTIETPMDSFMESIDSSFRDQGIDITSCVQKALCSYVKTSINESSQGKQGSSTSKIIDGLVNSNYLMSFIEGTAIRDAIEAGGSGTGNCIKKYPYCQLSQEEIFEKLFNYFNFY
ncbi:hypothetical protein ACFFRR_006601 [Megaselia abdita]